MAISSNTKANIQEAALALFRDKGYENTSINAICKAAGCSPSTFYYQFGSKDELVKSFISYDRVIDAALLTKLISLPSAWEKLWLVHESYTRNNTELGPSLCLKLFSQIATDDKDRPMIDDVMSAVELVVPIIREGQKSGEIQNTSQAEDLAMAVTYEMTGVIFAWCVSNGGFDVYETMERLLLSIYDIRRD